MQFINFLKSVIQLIRQFFQGLAQFLPPETEKEMEARRQAYMDAFKDAASDEYNKGKGKK